MNTNILDTFRGFLILGLAMLLIGCISSDKRTNLNPVKDPSTVIEAELREKTLNVKWMPQKNAVRYKISIALTVDGQETKKEDESLITAYEYKFEDIKVEENSCISWEVNLTPIDKAGKEGTSVKTNGKKCVDTPPPPAPSKKDVKSLNFVQTIEQCLNKNPKGIVFTFDSEKKTFLALEETMKIYLDVFLTSAKRDGYQLLKKNEDNQGNLYLLYHGVLATVPVDMLVYGNKNGTTQLITGALGEYAPELNLAPLCDQGL